MKKKLKNKSEASRGRPVTVRGIVIPVAWDGEGNALSASISCPGEQEYFVQQDQKGKELLKLTREEVEITGILKKTLKGQKTIAVTTYQLVNSYQ